MASLPEGYNTDIGSHGVSLSGGQRQRICVALVRNPRILILDEATSSLNSESERLVQAAIKCVAQGSHPELLRKSGAYYQMVRLTALPHENKRADQIQCLNQALSQ